MKETYILEVPALDRGRIPQEVIMKQKLELKRLEVQSFITGIDNEKRRLRGGIDDSVSCQVCRHLRGTEFVDLVP